MCSINQNDAHLQYKLQYISKLWKSGSYSKILLNESLLLLVNQLETVISKQVLAYGKLQKLIN